MSEEKKVRWHYTTEQKVALLDEADQPGQSVAVVARKRGVSPSVMFRWRQLREQGAVTGLKADEPLVRHGRVVREGLQTRLHLPRRPPLRRRSPGQAARLEGLNMMSPVEYRTLNQAA
jgi:transposase-like protein